MHLVWPLLLPDAVYVPDGQACSLRYSADLDSTGEQLVAEAQATWVRKEFGTGQPLKVPGELLVTNYQVTFRHYKEYSCV